jgi:hypothetical protein
MTFAELQRGVFDDLQYQAQPKPGVQDRVRRYLNEGLERVLRRPRLKNLRLITMPIISVPERGFYGAPGALERIDYIIDATNGHRLAFRTRDWYRALDQSAITSGTPSVWVPEGIVPVLKQPEGSNITGHAELYVVSTSLQDTTQSVRVRVNYFYGAEIEWVTALQPGTIVKMGELNQIHVTITAVTLSATCAGDVIVYDTPTPVDFNDYVALIQPGQLSSRHVGYRLYPTPSTSIQYHLEGQRVIPRMTRDEDEPPFSDNFHEMLQCYARARFYRKDGRLAQSREEMAEFERFALDLTAAVEYPVSYRPVAGKLSSGHGWSDLGPHYPADRFGGIND